MDGRRAGAGIAENTGSLMKQSGRNLTRRREGTKQSGSAFLPFFASSRLRVSQMPGILRGGARNSYCRRLRGLPRGVKMTADSRSTSSSFSRIACRTITEALTPCRAASVSSFSRTSGVRRMVMPSFNFMCCNVAQRSATSQPHFWEIMRHNAPQGLFAAHEETKGSPETLSKRGECENPQE